MNDLTLLEVLNAAADAVAGALSELEDWGPAGTHPGQYRCDLAADDAALAVLHRAGLAVMSEESGRTGGEQPVLVVLDPVDGSTNAQRGLPWFATSLCALDEDGVWAALVVNHPIERRYSAVRGAGALRDGEPIHPTSCARLDAALVGVGGLPARHPGWAQFRALGASALELCAVADGQLDGFCVPAGERIFGWDYLGGMLICQEAGAVVTDLDGSELVTRDGAARRPLAAATPQLLEELWAALEPPSGSVAYAHDAAEEHGSGA